MIMTSLEQAKINYADARVAFEIAQENLNRASQAMIAEIQKANQPAAPVEEKKEEVKVE